MKKLLMTSACVSLVLMIPTAGAVEGSSSGATCPAPDAAHIHMTTEKNRAVYSGHLDGTPKLMLQSDLENKGPAKKFDMMMLTPISPYFVSCWYNTGELVLKTQKGHFYTTEKQCELVGAKEGDVQKTSVASICSSDKVTDCKLVCH